MHNFQRQGKSLHCEGVPLAELADRYGTPLYVYSEATLSRHFHVFDQAFASLPHLICFAVKANGNLALLNLLASRGAGADIVSGGELFRALKAGIPAERIVYSGVGKTEAEMDQALEAGILLFNIESLQELAVLDRRARALGRIAPIALRVNPDVDPNTHPYVSTGLKTSKFGISFQSALDLYEQASRLANVQAIGVDCHIGSQLTELGPFQEAVSRLTELSQSLRQAGHQIQYLDLGGGLGITYDAEEPPTPAEYGEVICNQLAGQQLTLILEPGRNLVGNAGILLTRVLYTKEADDKRFVVVDAGMNDLIRPSLYDAFHAVVPVEDQGRDEQVVDVVGPICESGDFLARDRSLARLNPGELVAVMSAGAYGFTMASTYNSRPLAAEVLVAGESHQLVRQRGTFADLVRGEHIPERDQ
jgi:diaminopimelate decarboxylase